MVVKVAIKHLGSRRKEADDTSWTAYSRDSCGLTREKLPQLSIDSVSQHKEKNVAFFDQIRLKTCHFYDLKRAGQRVSSQTF